MCSSPGSPGRRARVRSVIRLVAAIAAIACGASASAQQPDVTRLSLADALAMSAQASHRLAESRARVDVAQAGVAAREAADRPTVTALAGYMRTNHVTAFGVPTAVGTPTIIYPDVPDNYRSRLDLEWLIYTGGRMDALEQAARA